MADTYPYEQLDGGRFQRLVQALFTDEYQGVQCLPLTGADGCRDAIQMINDGKSFTDAKIYQSKFREKQPLGEPTARTLASWLTNQLKAEAPTLEKLADKGATEYWVVTNLKGTGNLGSGLRDTMKDWSALHMPLPTAFWWRDDIDARLARHYDLVFHFGLFSGIDALRQMLDEKLYGSPGGHIRRQHVHPSIQAITSYLAEQYRVESKLRFEQADIPASPLLDLFVDVPLVHSNERRELLNTNDEQYLGRSGPHGFSKPIGAAAMLMQQSVSPNGMSRVVVQGAPGQGKSTLGQYVCQAHRIRMLNKLGDLAQLPEVIEQSPVRLPIRIEFRHLATWFSGVNPWLPDQQDKPQNWSPSVESFISAHIHHASGGLNMTADDVLSVLSGTPTFLFLDGLDEVPNIDMRRRLVEAAEASINRFEAAGADMQVLVTSRPAIFLKAPGFSRRGFEYYQLSSLTRELIRVYARGWISIRDLEEEHSAEITEVLEDNLHRPHVADLARNPMQLAILLSLIAVKGRSLPDQRTDLYEQYMAAFLDREAKMAVVREHRKRLEEIHQFLGWLLHSRAEATTSSRSGGDISTAELKQVIANFLIHEERDPGLVDDIFEGTARVFVLVSRIEGRFEFEVQPLREFFAGWYLYKTAAHSTGSNPAPGSMPDRLENLIRNPYWLNVARFFCGRYDKGQLADLARRLQDLRYDPSFSLMAHPRVLVAYMLRDRVTAESQRDTRELVETMCDPLGLRLLTSPFGSMPGSESSNDKSLLPADCGEQSYAGMLWKNLTETDNDEIAVNLSRAIIANSSAADRPNAWMAQEKNALWSRSQWLVRGVQTGAVAHIPLEKALEIFDPDTSSALDWIRCVEAGRFDVGTHDEARYTNFVNALAHGFSPLIRSEQCEGAGRLSSFGQVFDSCRIARTRSSSPFQQPAVVLGDVPCLPQSRSEYVGALDGLLHSCAFDLSTPDEFASGLDHTVSMLLDFFGESWIGWRTALIGGTLPSRKRRESVALWDASVSPIIRARVARLSANSIEYWRDAIDGGAQSLPRELTSWSAILAWGSPAVLKEVLPSIAASWDSAEPFDIRAVELQVSLLLEHSGVGRSRPAAISARDMRSLRELPISLMHVLRNRADSDALMSIVRLSEESYKRQPDLDSHKHGSLIASSLLTDTLRAWVRHGCRRNGLVKVSQLYLQCKHSPFSRVTSDPEYRRITEMGIPVAKEILRHPNEFPAYLIHVAQIIVADNAETGLTPLGTIALREKWFEGLPW